MPNRILAAAQEYERRLAGQNDDQLGQLRQSTKLTPGEGPTYQDWQARAHAAGILTLDEANTIYRALSGEAARWADDTPLALRLAITQTMAELGRALLSPA